MNNVLAEIGISPDSVTDFDRRVIRYICECVSVRAAALAGAGVASLVSSFGRTGLEPHPSLTGWLIQALSSDDPLVR